MITRAVLLILTFFFLNGCGIKKTLQPDFTGIYTNSDTIAYYEIKFVNDSILKLTQTFHCVKLPDSLRSKEINVLYKTEKPKVLRSKKFIEPLGSNKLTYIRVKMFNISRDTIKYPFVNDFEACSIFNEIHRFDRKVFDGRKMYSPYDKANIINFKNTYFDYRINDNTISFALKVFKKLM